MNQFEEELAKECEDFHPAVPTVGKIYHVFDSGKIKWSRHYLAKCTAIIPFEEFSTDKKWAIPFKSWKDTLEDDIEEEVDDDMRIAISPDPIVECDTMFSDGVIEKEYFALNERGCWVGFSGIGDGFLDINRKLWETFYEEAHDPKYGDYLPSVMDRIEQMNNI